MTTTLTYFNVSNSTGRFKFFWSDVNNLDRVACLKVRFSGNGSVVFNTCSTSGTGSIFCFINQTNGTAVYVAVGSIDGVPVRSFIRSIGDFAGDRIDWGVTGYVVAIMLVLVAYFSFSASPTISLLFGTVVFVLFGVFGLILKDVNYGVFMGVLVVAFMIARIKSEGGVNG